MEHPIARYARLFDCEVMLSVVEASYSCPYPNYCSIPLDGLFTTIGLYVLEANNVVIILLSGVRGAVVRFMENERTVNSCSSCEEHCVLLTWYAAERLGQ